MTRWITRILITVAVVIAVAIVGGWLLLSSDLLAGPRGKLAAGVLSRQLGQDVQIDGGVEIDLGAPLHLRVRDLTLPGTAMDDVTFVKAGAVEVDLDLGDLIGGTPTLSAPRIDGLMVTLVVDETGATSWGPASPTPKKPGKPGGLKQFLARHQITATNSTVIYRDARNGLDLDLNMANLALGRGDTAGAIALTGDGTLNGEALTLSAQLPDQAPFKATLAFDHMRVDIDGSTTPDGFSADANVQIDDLNQLLAALKLNGPLPGTGTITANLSRAGDTSGAKADIHLDLQGGQSLTVTADIPDLSQPKNSTVGTLIKLYPDDAQPPKTTKRRDLKLTAVDMQLTARPGQPPLRSMVIETNGFVLDTGGEGPPPIEVGGIKRTPDGLLELGKVTLRIGPTGRPYAVLDGSIGDALKLQQAALTGTLSIPAASLIAPEVFQDSRILGELTGGFDLNGSIQKLSLSNLNTRTEGTDLWDLTVHGSVDNVLKFDTIALDIDARIPSASNLLGTLGLEPVKGGPAEMSISLNSEGTEFSSSAHLRVDDSELDFALDLKDGDAEPIVRGTVDSDLIRVEHIREIIAASVQLAKLDDLQAGGKEAKPAVQLQSDETRPIRDSTLQPFGRAILLSGMDIEVALDLRKIKGPKASTSINSEFELKKRLARLGPVKFAYGGGNFDMTAEVDLENSPELLKVSGAAGGWDLGRILGALNVKKGARGTLHANVDLSGHHAGFRDFLSSMNGSATVSMHGGSIDTQLLDVAGLGVVPWLFHKKPGKTAPITCLRAPLYVSGGKVTTKQSVVETDLVQLVVYGDVNYRAGTLNVNGQPRRIGKPLSRSPWPFTAKGSLKKPDIKVKDGPRKLKRRDGASTMPRRRKPCVPDILQLK